MTILTRIFTAACLLLLAPIAGADLASDLNQFVDDLGGATTATNPSIFEGQGYRYIDGGQLFVRMPARTINLASYRAPNYRAGCGGIDVFGGGFSFIDANELVTTLKNIGSNAASYAFMLALRTISSQISNSLGEAWDWMQENRNLTVDTCKQAQWAVNSTLGGQVLAVEESVCITRRMQVNGDTYTEAQEACTVAGGVKEATVNDPAAKEQTFFDGNLTWILMHEANMFAADTELREVLMSITGSAIRSKRDAGGALAPGDENAVADHRLLPSLLAEREDLLQAALYGGDATVYRCNATGKFECKEPVPVLMTVTAADSMVVRANSVLTSLYNKVQSGGAPTSTEIQFVQISSLPLHRILNVGASIRGTTGSNLVERYSEKVAIDILFVYLNRLLDNLSSRAGDPQYGADSDKMLQQIAQVRALLAKRKREIDVGVDRRIHVLEELQYYERLLISGLPKSIAANFKWAANAAR